jgi:hypothetical protein
MPLEDALVMTVTTTLFTGHCAVLFSMVHHVSSKCFVVHVELSIH